MTARVLLAAAAAAVVAGQSVWYPLDGSNGAWSYVGAAAYLGSDVARVTPASAGQAGGAYRNVGGDSLAGSTGNGNSGHRCTPSSTHPPAPCSRVVLLDVLHRGL